MQPKNQPPQAVFFDTHCHLHNLDDIALSVILAHYFKALKKLSLKDWKTILELFSLTRPKRLVNLLKTMEKKTAEIIEEVYASLDAVAGLDSPVKVLLPQVMDFEAASSSERVAFQVASLKDGITSFFKKHPVSDLFIFPFLGIDPRHFAAVGEMEDYLRLNLAEVITGWPLESGNCIGIKVYPPLGFDPEPDDPGEMEKMKALVDFCARHELPITCHTSRLGFNSDDEYEAKTDPAGWRWALERRGDLRLNLAHFGGRVTYGVCSRWQRTILGFIRDRPNVYTDLSFIADRKGDARRLRSLIRHRNTGACRIEDKVLFGSDYSIVLLKSESLSRYILDARASLGGLFERFSSANVFRFLGPRVTRLLPAAVNRHAPGTKREGEKYVWEDEARNEGRGSKHV